MLRESGVNMNRRCGVPFESTNRRSVRCVLSVTSAVYTLASRRLMVTCLRSGACCVWCVGRLVCGSRAVLVMTLFLLPCGPHEMLFRALTGSLCP